MRSSAVARLGAGLNSPFSGEWLTRKDIKGPLVILIHGLAGNGVYLTPLAALLNAYDYSTAVFEYDSHLGVKVSATALRDRLTKFGDETRERGYSLVGHSFGGLVAKCAAADGLPHLRSLVTLGTPHVAWIGKPQIVAAIIRATENFTAPKPYGRSLACQALREVTGCDDHELLSELCEACIPVPVLSLSGGLPYVEFGSSRVANKLWNHILQHLLGEHPNDGLVPESSADGRRHLNGQVEHVNDYPEYKRTNHFGLTRNQEIALRIVSWLRVHHPRFEERKDS
jgi:pimeloyl-ACP methyl ester carboxylesterase